MVLNAATSSVGQCLLQLSKLLRLRAVAVARCHGDAAWDKTAAWLRSLGACEVLKDEGSLRVGAGLVVVVVWVRWPAAGLVAPAA